MSERFLAQCATVCVVSLAIELAGAAFAQGGVEANGSMALTEVPISSTVERDPESISPHGEVRMGENEESSSNPGSANETKPDQASLTVDPPVIESKPLGRPGNSPIARQSEESESGSAPKSFIAQFDPRSNDVARVIGALSVVIGLILMLRTIVRRASGMAGLGGRPSGVLEILAKYPIGRGQQLILLKLARRIVLLHQSGSTMTALSEMTDADEVAALLARMEAGSAQRDAVKFRKTFNEFMADHNAIANKSSRASKAQLPPGEAEIVDLTRRKPGVISKVFGWRGAR